MSTKLDINSLPLKQPSKIAMSSTNGAMSLSLESLLQFSEIWLHTCKFYTNDQVCSSCLLNNFDEIWILRIKRVMKF